MQTQSQPIDFNPPTHDAPPIMLPEARRIFAERASRFSHLAEGHSLGDWLAFLGELSRAQHDILAEMTPMPLPDAAQLVQSRSFGMPPLNPGPQSLPPFWRDAVRHLAHRLLKPAPEVGRPTLEALITASDAQLEIWARLMLDGEPTAADVPFLPFVAAALQVVFTGQASQLDVSQLQRLDVPGVCPCCGSLPVASVVRQAAGIANLRYLHCSLCNTEWNLARATCAACGDDEKIVQHQIEGSNGAVRTETCDACKSYLKIFYQEKDMQLDPVADDLATLALDMLVDDAGYARSGPNLLLINASA